jgi:hypothetical protein
MAAQANVWGQGQPPFDTSREYVLTHSTPPIRIANLLTNSTTRSTYRLHWNRIALWNDFSDRVIQYWNTVPQLDRQGNVMLWWDYVMRFRRVGNSEAGNEGEVKTLIYDFVEQTHSAAANGNSGAPRPSDRHSKLQRWEQGAEANNLAGIPDFVMATEDGNPPRRVTAILEVKNPSLVTPARIDQVIQSITRRCVLSNLLDQVPLSGKYPARLAIEQQYGYMVRNGKAYGVLTTMKGWCFLRRENGGQLYITRMFGDFEAQEGISQGAVDEGYYATPGFSIMKALYFLSALAEATPNLPETPIDGHAGQVTLPYSEYSTAAASTIQQPPPGNVGLGFGGLAAAHGGQGGNEAGFQGVQILGGYDQAECSQYDDDFNYRDFQFEPWLPENNLGPKTWIASTLPARTKVVLKLWDAWKFDSGTRNNEASVYLHLRSLWGKCDPSLLVKSALEYGHALIFQYIRV